MIRTSLRVFIYFIRSIIYSIKVIYELIETVVFYTIYIITQMIERINKYIIIKIFIMLNIGYREDKIEKMYKLIKKIIPYENKRTFIFIFLKVYLCVMWILIICKIIYIMILNIFKNWKYKNKKYKIITIHFSQFSLFLLFPSLIKLWKDNEIWNKRNKERKIIC